MSFNALLTGGEALTLKPTTVGETLGGTIVAAESRQVLDYSTQEPKTWKDGSPQMQIVVTVTTGDKTDDGEDELGKIYIKTWGEQKVALLNAIRATGLDADHALAPGNTMTITYQGEKPNEKNPRFNATKVYEYTIEARANIGGALNDQPAPQAPQTAPAPATTPATATPAPDNAVSTARQLIAAGLDDTTIANTTGLDQTVINALRNN